MITSRVRHGQGLAKVLTIKQWCCRRQPLALAHFQWLTKSQKPAKRSQSACCHWKWCQLPVTTPQFYSQNVVTKLTFHLVQLKIILTLSRPKPRTLTCLSQVYQKMIILVPFLLVHSSYVSSERKSTMKTSLKTFLN